MSCAEFAHLLCAYHDGELSPDSEAAMAAHIAICPECRAEVNLFRKLSALASQLEEHTPTKEVWRNIEERLHSEASPSEQKTLDPLRRLSRKTTVGMIVVLMLGLSFVAYAVFPAHKHAAINLGPFLDVFERSPQDAQELLITTYAGRRVGFDEAVKELMYRPITADGLPTDYELSEANLLQMPCCKCLEACYRRKGGGMLCIFEHERNQFVRFGDRDVSSTVCVGNPTRVVQMAVLLTATWQQNDRFITVVGAEGIDELSRLMHHFERPESAVEQ